MSTQSIDRLLDKAKVGLLSIKHSVFISTVLFSLKFEWRDDVPTACTNGLNLLINPKFFEDLNKEERIFLLAHEAWHVAFQHMARMNKEKEDNFNVWNQACDHFINIMLINSGYKMPKGGLASHEYHDQMVWSSDKIFRDLMDNQDKQDPDFDDDFECAGGGEPSDGEGDEDGKSSGGMSKEEIERKIEDIVVKASVQSKISGDKPGTIPGEIATTLDKLLNPKLPWNIILMNFMNAFAKEDYTWKRPNRRFMPDIYMPSLYSESLGHIAVAVDTSCSVTDQQFTAFRTEIDNIQRTMNPESMDIVDFDTQIHNIFKIKQGEDVSHIKFSGRGGTNMHPVFDHYNDPKNKPKVLIIFSDMECAEITEKPGYPVIWIKLKGHGFEPTFGTAVEFDV